MNIKSLVEWPSKWPKGYGKIWYEMMNWKQREIIIECEKNTIQKKVEK